MSLYCRRSHYVWIWCSERRRGQKWESPHWWLLEYWISRQGFRHLLAQVRACWGGSLPHTPPLTSNGALLYTSLECVREWVVSEEVCETRDAEKRRNYFFWIGLKMHCSFLFAEKPLMGPCLALQGVFNQLCWYLSLCVCHWGRGSWCNRAYDSLIASVKRFSSVTGILGWIIRITLLLLKNTRSRGESSLRLLCCWGLRSDRA